jgi:hypothetical protein
MINGLGDKSRHGVQPAKINNTLPANNLHRRLIRLGHLDEEIIDTAERYVQSSPGVECRSVDVSFKQEKADLSTVRSTLL